MAVVMFVGDGRDDPPAVHALNHVSGKGHFRFDLALCLALGASLELGN